MSVGKETDQGDGPRREAVSVLVVEDEVDDARFVLDAIEDEGFEVEVEVTPYGERGLELARDRGFDCVLLDYRLPRMDGTEFVREARKDDLDVPIVVLTGRGSEDVERELRQAGADAYLDKAQGDEASIQSTIEEVLR